MRTLLATTLLTVIAAGCASPTPSPSGSAAAPPASGLATAGQASDDRFALTIEIAKEQYQADEPIELRTTFTFLGPEARVTASGSGGGLVIVALEQLDGPLDPGGGADSSCAPYELARGVPNVVPYRKSGGWDATDPNAAWYQAFFADPALRLPAGTWRLTAHLEASLAACDGEWHQLDAAVTFEVAG